ncbi:MAG: hypothetical protein RLZZ301_740 [Bacteroidota bacterium]|jgi:hypothetical protein
MKRIYLALVLLTSTVSFAQSNKWGLQFNTGAHLLSEAGTGITMNAGVTYNFTPAFDLKLDGGLDFIGDDNLNRLGLQAGLDVVKLANKTSKFGLQVHAGGSLINNGNYRFNDSYLMRGDDMLAVMGGLSPRFEIDQNLWFLIDASYLKLFKIDGDITKYMNVTVGLAYKF